MTNYLEVTNLSKSFDFFQLHNISLTSVSYTHLGAEGLPAIARENPLTEELRQELLAIDGVESITSHEVTSATVKFPQESVALKFPVFDREQMGQWLPEENLEQGSADYEELAANNGVVVTDSEDHLLSMFYGYTPAVGDVLTFESMDGKEMCIRDSKR